ncbi:MAG: heme exporter protein CcmD [Proteobacteria bacterium]|jgi:heme exporter protein CcmD|nr:heme exporter protein CcmD [Pseudomonadota bacterium]MDA0971775.1 heme exporter protein CcmD [Pseudomonadota bacterium]MDA0995980.1 heme exporter protein CcmD [Pseudomonadota bacterium]
MIEFLNMGGYAVFVWSSYAVAFFLVTLLYVRSVKALKTLQSITEASVSEAQEVSAKRTFKEKSLA